LPTVAPAGAQITKLTSGRNRRARRCDGVPLSAQTRLDYIKRVVGVPGDEVVYPNKKPDGQRGRSARRRFPDFFE
jgi:signal peptidase I